MASINDILYTSRSGLLAHQTALQTTSDNISNASTPGYSRKRVNFASVGGNGMMPGVGTSVADVRRVHDQFLERQNNAQLGQFGFLEGRQFVSQQLEAVFPELEIDGINNALNEFFNSWNELSNNISGISEREVVLQDAQTLADRINNAYDNVNQMQLDLNLDIEGNVTQANELFAELADLNRQIAVYSDPNGDEASNLLDRRDQVVRELSEMLDITTFSDDDGNINALLYNRVMVEGSSVGELSVAGGPLYSIEMTTVGGVTTDITAEMQGANGSGHLTGMIYERDVFLEDIKSRMDLMAFNLANRVNTLHATGFDLNGNAGGDFFEPIAAVNGAAGLLQLSAALTGNPEGIAASGDPLAPHGNNTIALAISDLANDETTMGSQSFSEYFVATVGRISNNLNSLESEIDYQQAALDQTEAYRASVSGVSVDEEMISLIQYQRAFEASAKMIQTVDEMLSAVIALKQ